MSAVGCGEEMGMVPISEGEGSTGVASRGVTLERTSMINLSFCRRGVQFDVARPRLIDTAPVRTKYSTSNYVVQDCRTEDESTVQYSTSRPV